jgi:hypothetical protein
MVSRIGLRKAADNVVLLPSAVIDTCVGWLGGHERVLDWLIVAFLIAQCGVGVSLGTTFQSRGETLTGVLLGALLVASACGGIYLVTPNGKKRAGAASVRNWFRGMAAVCLAVGLVFLGAAITVQNPGTSDDQMLIVSLAGSLALLSGVISLR